MLDESIESSKNKCSINDDKSDSDLSLLSCRVFSRLTDKKLSKH